MADVIIIGGGPAGSMAGAYLSKAGVDNLIVEQATQPRRRAGESLLPSTTRNFDDVGVLAALEREGFPRRGGTTWHPASANAEVSIELGEFPRPGIDPDRTYHVDRARLDELLLDHAGSLGSEVMRGAAVTEVLFDGTAAAGVRATVDGDTVDVPARIVLDCSGRSTVLGNQLGLRTDDPVLDQVAVSARFEGVAPDRNPDTEDHTHVHLLPVGRGWAWQIPVTGTVTSVGVVAPRLLIGDGASGTEGWFDDMVAANPDLARALEPAIRVGPVTTESCSSYRMERLVGDGWMLLGDAARFVDPVFSSGVSIACESARFASEYVVKALETGDRSAAMLKPYEERMAAGVAVWYEFIRLYYKLMHLFAFFVQAREYRQQIHQLLQGEVFDRAEVPVLEAMRTIVETVERTPGHLWARYLTDMPVD